MLVQITAACLIYGTVIGSVRLIAVSGLLLGGAIYASG